MEQNSFSVREYTPEQKGPLLDFLEQCLPESGRVLELQGRHSFYLDIPSQFERFWCLYCGQALIGTVALKRLSSTGCELKSLYLSQAYQGKGLGRKLLELGISTARQKGYEQMYLDTMLTSSRAIQLYKRAGFVPTEPYHHNPHADLFLVLQLNPPSL